MCAAHVPYKTHVHKVSISWTLQQLFMPSVSTPTEHHGSKIAKFAISLQFMVHIENFLEPNCAYDDWRRLVDPQNFSLQKPFFDHFLEGWFCLATSLTFHWIYFFRIKLRTKYTILMYSLRALVCPHSRWISEKRPYSWITQFFITQIFLCYGVTLLFFLFWKTWKKYVFLNIFKKMKNNF